jgi:hypothetical protein
VAKKYPRAGESWTWFWVFPSEHESSDPRTGIRRRAFARRRSQITKANTIIYRSGQPECAKCPIKKRCCPNTPMRKIARSIRAPARQLTRQIATTEYRRSRRDRKKVEILFAHPKRILKLNRLRLCGLSGARDEFTLAATAQNLRRLAGLMPKGPLHGPLRGVAR